MPDLAPNHAPANFTETTGTLTNTTVSIAAKGDRRGLIIGNPSDTIMFFRVGATASATAGVPIPPESSVMLTGPNTPSALVSVFCAGTSKAYCAYEW
jgi:hypothetical protein